MFRRRDPAAPLETEAPTAGAKVEMPRRVLDVPVGPSGQGGTAAVPGRNPLSGEAVPLAMPEPAAERQLTVGDGIRLEGQISACDRLVVHGHVAATLERSERLEIAKGGCFEGKTEVETADVAGCFRGELVVRGRLLVRSSGIVEGSVRFGELEIERGGQLRGNVAANEPETAPKLAPVISAAGGQGD